MNKARPQSAILWGAVYSIWIRNFRQFKKSWLVSLFWIVLEPVFILTALGFGLGSFVPDISGVAYVEFFFPALLCTSAMMVAFFVSAYDGFSKLTYQKLYSSMITTRIEPREIVLGEMLWAATKGTMSSFGVLIVATAFGLVHWAWVPLALAIIFVSSALFSTFGIIVTSFVRNYEQIIYPTSGIIVPMSLFAGTYFPLEQYPIWIKPFLYILPLTHEVEAVRTLFLHGWSNWILLNIAFLIVFLFVFIRWSIHRIERILVN